MIQYWFEKHRELQARRAEKGFDGFTLIELLIVIVVLGILAAVVVFALGGVTGQSKQSACNADAKSVEVAVQAFHSYPSNTDNHFPANMASLTGGGLGATFLRSAPSATVAANGYSISLGAGGVVNVTTSAGTGNYDNQTATTLCNSLT